MIDYQKENEKILAEYKDIAAKNHEDIIYDGLMYCGKIEYKGGCWERTPGNENELYEKMTPKILLLTKDFPDDRDISGDGGTEDIRIESFRINGKEFPETSGIRFHQNIMTHVWGLTHYMPEKGICPKWYDEHNSDLNWSWDDAREYYETAPIVRINVKKIPGSTTINDSMLNDYMYNKDYKPLLLQQIKLFNPDIIVCYGQAIFEFIINPQNNIIPDIKQTNKWAHYSQKQNKIVINSYHPSYWGRPEDVIYTEMMKSYEEILNEHKELAKKWFH